MAIGRRHLILAGAGAGACLLAAAAGAQQTGVAPLEGGTLKIVVPYPPGGTTDRAARLVADAIAPRLGVTVIVENRVGAGGRLAAQQVHKDASGQNLVLLANPATMLVAPLVFKDAGYDPEKDYVPLSQVTRYDFGIAVGPAVPVREFGHLRAWMQANEDKLSAGIPATGSLPHFFALMLADKMRIKMPVVGYKGSAPLLNDLMGGHVPIAIDSLDALEPLQKGGKLRILAVSGERRSATLKDVPTFREAGLDLSAEGWNVLYAPAGMPAARRNAIAAAVEQAMSDKALQARFAAADMVPVASNAAKTGAMLAAYRAQWTPVVRNSGFQP